jgi:hypothetical protein
MIKKLTIGLACTLFLSSCLYADWLDDLITLVGQTEIWEPEKAEAIVDIYLKGDEERVQKIENKLKALGSGFWAVMHWGGYKAELLNACSEKRYHEKLIKAFKELPENKKDREKLVQNLIALYRYQHELDELNVEYQKAQGITDKTKFWTLIKAKQTAIYTKRSFIKSSFLF